jgi:hypothetical protein
LVLESLVIAGTVAIVDMVEVMVELESLDIVVIVDHQGIMVLMELADIQAQVFLDTQESQELDIADIRVIQEKITYQGILVIVG